jgi:hypothetical protein
MINEKQEHKANNVYLFREGSRPLMSMSTAVIVIY